MAHPPWPWQMLIMLPVFVSRPPGVAARLVLLWLTCASNMLSGRSACCKVELRARLGPDADSIFRAGPRKVVIGNWIFIVVGEEAQVLQY